jgi:hypothetical protein
MPDRNPFTIVEIDLPTCANVYGSSPCTAAIGVTGAVKCYNTIPTCQDRTHLVENVTTLRMCNATQDAPYDAIPCLQSVNVTPGVIDPGRSIGQRGKVKVSAAEFQTGDALLDKYLTSRTYVPFEQGTFWAKLRGRIKSLQGAPLRVMRGELGADLSTYIVEHYFVETMVLDADGVDIVAKDALSFCDPKKAQCPPLSTGRLFTAIDADDIALTLTPTGIGNLEYPSSGVLCLSGKELVTFTRVNDVVTITGRAQYGTKAQEHDEDSVAQQVVFFNAMSAADITYSLLVDYTPGVDAAWCDLSAWQAEADLYVGHLYHAIIPVPTPVKTLLDEMMQQAGCSLWWDPAEEKINFQALRPITPSATILDGDSIVEGSFRWKEQPDKRVSQHTTYYGLADPTNKVDKESNFRAAVLKVDAPAEDDYGAPAYATTLARWIAIDNRPAAERLNAMRVSRYRDPPRLAELTLFPTNSFLPQMGRGVQVRDPSLQNADGSPATVTFYLTSREVQDDAYHYEAEEFTFSEDAIPDTTRAVFIDVDHFNLDLRALYNTLYSSVPAGATVNFTVSPGAFVGGAVLGGRSIDVGTWPSDTIVRLIIASADDLDSARVLGRGGNGGGYPGPSTNGEAGSVAIYTRRALLLKNYGTIGGGGGGGEGRVGFDGFGAFFANGGGGGAGFNGYRFGGARIGGARGNGYSTTPSEEGAPTVLGGGDGAGGPQGPGGNGGDLAQDGHYYTGAEHHSAGGIAIDGVSFVTFEVTGTIIGAQVN